MVQARRRQAIHDLSGLLAQDALGYGVKDVGGRDPVSFHRQVDDRGSPVAGDLDDDVPVTVLVCEIGDLCIRYERYVGDGVAREGLDRLE